LLLWIIAMETGTSFRYPEGKRGCGVLAYSGPVPVLRLTGSPEEIADQAAVLALRPAIRLLDYTVDLLAYFIGSKFLAKLLVPQLEKLGRKLLPRFPTTHRRELESLGESVADMQRVVRANTLFDLKNLQPWRLFGCSSLATVAERSETGTPLLGRNLDFFPLGYLHEYSLVTVYAPHGCLKFVSVGFPGTVGCFSGMNEAGLAAATHEVFGAQGPGFNPRGVPFASAVRRVLETCKTIDEAEEAFRKMPRTTAISVVLCDRRTAAVLEICPNSVVRRDPTTDVCVCTNHFLSPALKSWHAPNTFGSAYRLRVLERMTTASRRFGVSDLFAILHTVNGGPLTLQSMVFEPAHLSLHLSIGKGPASAYSPTELRLTDWL
jgi:hypothetical protein